MMPFLFEQLPSEARLMVGCARSRPQPADTARLRAWLEEPVEWARLLETAGRHRTLSLLYWNLKEAGFAGVPATVRDALRAHFQQATHRNFFLTRELLRLLDDLRVQGIQAVPLKGPVLTAQYYGTPGLRSFIDLDLLVPAADLGRCREFLPSLGYRAPDDQQGEWAERHRQAQLGFDYLRADGLVRLEVHWALIQKWLSFRVAPEHFWQRRVTVKVGGLPVDSLAPEDNLVYLCAHGSKHQWERLIWICDVAELIRAETNLAWDEVLARARASRSLRSLLWGLQLAHELLGAAVPAHVLERARAEPAVESLFRTTARRFLDETGEADRAGPEFKSDRTYLLGMDRLVDRCGYVFHLAKLYVQPSEKDRNLIRLPGAFAVLYLILRPFRILLGAIPSAIRKWKHCH